MEQTHQVDGSPLTAGLDARASVTTSFRLSRLARQALDKLATQSGIAEKDLLDEITDALANNLEDVSLIDRLKEAAGKVELEEQRHSRVVTRGTLRRLENACQRLSLERDILLDALIQIALKDRVEWDESRQPKARAALDRLINAADDFDRVRNEVGDELQELDLTWVVADIPLVLDITCDAEARLDAYFGSVAESEREDVQIDKLSLQSDFTKRKPAVVLIEKDPFFAGNWKDVLLGTVEYLRTKDPVPFQTLTRDPHFTSKRNNPYFSDQPSRLRRPHELADGVFVELNLSANNIREVLGRLLDHWGIPQAEFSVVVESHNLRELLASLK